MGGRMGNRQGPSWHPLRSIVSSGPGGLGCQMAAWKDLVPIQRAPYGWWPSLLLKLSLRPLHVRQWGLGVLSKGLGQFRAPCEHTGIIPRNHINLGWGCSVRHPQAHKLRQTSQPFPFWHLEASWSSTCKRGSYLDTPGISVVSYPTAGWGVARRCLFFLGTN